VTIFKRPQARNASMTLVIMGAISIGLLVGLAYLSSHAGVTISEERSVVAQVAFAVYHGGIGFYVVQFFSAAILMLGANTAFQGFPQLASILARDRFMPRQFYNRGDRLVFSNGILALGTVASVLIVWAGADVNRLIQLYVVGVFTAFTLSQIGMVRHWLKVRRTPDAATSGWQRSIAFNGVGGVTTFVVTVVVTLSKFAEGAWISILGMVLLASTFWMISRHYADVMIALRRGRVRVREQVAVNRAVLVVRDFDRSLAEALGYVRSFHPPEFRAVWAGKSGSPAGLTARWAEVCVAGGPELEILPSGGSLVGRVKRYVGAMERGRPDFITVVVPETVREGGYLYILKHLETFRLKAGMLRVPNVVVANVPVMRDRTPGAAAGAATGTGTHGRALIPNRVVALLFVSAINDATIHAVNYARTLDAAETRAVHFVLDPGGSGSIVDEWVAAGLPIPLEVTEAPFRDLTTPMMAAVREVTARGDTIAAVIAPEYVMKRRHMILHNQNAFFAKRLFLTEERAVLTSVPWTLDM